MVVDSFTSYVCPIVINESEISQFKIPIEQIKNAKLLPDVLNDFDEFLQKNVIVSLENGGWKVLYSMH